LKFVDGKLGSLESDASKIPPIRDINTNMEAAGITNNNHTTLTLKDLEVQFEQYREFLNVKKKMLEEEIAHQKLRGITPEQFNEIENNFKTFDANKSGTIDKKELKACLYSLGEEKTKREVEEIMTKFGKNNSLPYEGFREFMIGLVGDSDTKDEILNGFKLINRGGESALVAHLEMVMKDYDIQYFTKTAPKAGSGFDYVKWTEDMFSR